MPAPRRQPDGPPRPTAAERRRAALRACAPLLAARGPGDLALDDLAAAAGASPSRFARDYATVGAVYEAVLGELLDAVAAGLPHADPSPDPLADLHLVLARVAALAGDPDDHLKALRRGLADPDHPEARPGLRAFLAGAAARLTPLVRDGQQAGVFRRGLDPRRAARELVRGLVGYAAVGCAGDDEDGVPHAFDCLLHGLLKTDV